MIFPPSYSAPVNIKNPDIDIMTLYVSLTLTMVPSQHYRSIEKGDTSQKIDNTATSLAIFI
jgi:hypothetical protein